MMIMRLTERLDRPYSLARFKEGFKVPIRTKCLLKFTARDIYRNKVWCDVALLGVCHILLSQPWQFDRCTIHDGKENTYTFLKDDIRVKHVPDRDPVKPPRSVTIGT